jgi:hypothetical protein
MKQLPEKIDPLIRRLATDSDGETVACVRAIGRVLAAAGMTFHDLADRLKAPAQGGASTYGFGYDRQAQHERAERATREYRERKQREAAAAADVPGDFDTWLEAVEWAVNEKATMTTPREKEFLQSLSESLPRWHRPTEKQEKWLRDILRKCGVT